jgi:glycosyltransferase involved in cell wall biosynthesis
MSDIKGKKILFIIPSYNIGGAERQASNLAMYYAGKGANVSVLTVDGKKAGPLYAVLQQKGINCLTIEIDIYFFDKFKNYLPTPSNIKFLGKMREQIKEIKNIFASIAPQLIFPFCYTPNVIANNFYDAKHSFCIWNQRDLGLPPFNHSRYEKKALQKTKQIISNSSAGAEYVSNSTGIPLKEIKVIPNAVVIESTQLSRESFRALYKIDPETILLTMVANFSASKDQETVVKAMKNLAGKNCKLLLVGRFDGTEKNILHLINELGLKDKVLVLPFSNDVSGIYSASDIAIHSSLSEGLPNSLLEAMACGLPVVASDISSHKNVLKDDEHVLFTPKNANHLAERLSVLIADKDLRANYGKANKKLVVTEYTLDKVAEQYLQLENAS